MSSHRSSPAEGFSLTPCPTVFYHLQDVYNKLQTDTRPGAFDRCLCGASCFIVGIGQVYVQETEASKDHSRAMQSSSIGDRESRYGGAEGFPIHYYCL
jgi:hypothetical protein